MKPVVRPDRLKSELQLPSGKEVARMLKCQFEYQAKHYPAPINEKEVLRYLQSKLGATN
jgi:hypothetical protein